jgi:hypothetical protein
MMSPLLPPLGLGLGKLDLHVPELPGNLSLSRELRQELQDAFERRGFLALDLLPEPSLDHAGVRGQLAGEDERVKVGAILAQAAKGGGARCAGRGCFKLYITIVCVQLAFTLPACSAMGLVFLGFAILGVG